MSVKFQTVSDLPSREASLVRLARAAHRAERRARFDAALGRAARIAPVPLLYAIVALVFVKVAQPAASTLRRLELGVIVPLVVWLALVLWAYLARRPREFGARLLDRHHGLADRVSSALAFASLPGTARSPLMQAAIDDAIQLAPRLEPRRASPLHLPSELPLVLLLTLGLLGIALIEVRSTRVVLAEKHLDPLVMSEDDLELFRDMARELEKRDDDPETLAAVRRFNQLIEDIAQRRIDRSEVFERLGQLERDLMKGADADKQALGDGLRALASELERSDLAKPLAKALADHNLADAEKALRELAERLEKKQDPPSKAELDKLREALQKASQANKSRKSLLDKQRTDAEQQRQQLLKKQQEKTATSQDRSLLKKKDRELERLDRERQQAERAERRLSRLDRELDQAAQDLARELGISAQDLERAAEDINHMSREELTEADKEELRRRIEELRELLRQQGQGGAERMKRLQRFAQRAHGTRGRTGKQGAGQQGKGESGSGREKGEQGEGEGEGEGDEGRDGKGKHGKSGEGQDGEGGKSPGGKHRRAQGEKGQGEGDGEGEGTADEPGDGISIEPGGGSGASVELPGGPGGDGQGGGEQPGGEGAGKGGQSWGTGHDGNLTGGRSKGTGKTHDVSAAGIDTGRGSASSQVIHGAAQRGFVGRGYKKIYTDYHTVAEQVMKQDDIPPGYRFYVKRYFQLIRPRE